MRQRLPAVIESHGLRLRPGRDGDLDDIVTACNDPRTAEFATAIPVPYTRADAAAWLAAGRARAEAEADVGAVFVIADLAGDRLLGAVGLNRLASSGHSLSIGYWVAPWARRRGVATSATRAAVRAAFDREITRIELTHRLDNEASMRVAMSASFTHEGVRRAGDLMRDGGHVDIAVWSRLSSDPDKPSPPGLPDLPGGQLSDGVVTLRPLAPADADDYFALARLPEVIATTVTVAPLTLERIARRCHQARYQWLLGQQAQFTIRDAATDAFAGLISMISDGATGQAMLGYDVTRQHRGHGFAPRAVRLLTTWAFRTVGVARLVAGAAPDNLASQRVLEKAGFAREGFERARLPRSGDGGRVDNISWAILPDDAAEASGASSPPEQRRDDRI